MRIFRGIRQEVLQGGPGKDASLELLFWCAELGKKGIQVVSGLYRADQNPKIEEIVEESRESREEAPQTRTWDYGSFSGIQGRWIVKSRSFCNFPWITEDRK